MFYEEYVRRKKAQEKRRQQKETAGSENKEEYQRKRDPYIDRRSCSFTTPNYNLGAGNMGASASMLEIDRNPELTQKLKEEYERLSAEGYIDSQIEVQLRESYQEQVNEHNKKMKKVDLFARIAAANPTLKGVDISTSDVKMPKLEPIEEEKQSSSRNTIDKRRNSRLNRRSFDNSNFRSGNLGGGSSTGGARAVASSKTKQDLRMIKRSKRQSFTGDKNPIKKDGDDVQKSIPKHVNMNIDAEKDGDNKSFIKPVSPKRQVEGKDFVLLYEGPKLFWRQHITLYINMYLHKESDCVEVIGFDSEKFKEMNRSYLSLSKLKSLTESVAKKRLEAILLEREEYGFKGPSQSEEELLDIEKDKAIVGHILDRMHLVKAENASLIEDFRYIPAKGMVEIESPELSIIPENLEPVKITRRRHTNMDDVNRVKRYIILPPRAH